MRKTRIVGFVATILVALAVFMFTTNVDGTKGSYPLDNSVTGRATNGVIDDPIIGSADAPITILIFNDFTSDYGKSVHLFTLKYIKEDYVATGKAKVVFKDFPYSKESVFIAEAAQCAHEQGKFWEVADSIYRNRDEWINSTNYLNFIRTYAVSEGVNPTQFDDCVKERKYQNEIAEDRKEGLGMGIQYAPMAYVNDKKVTAPIFYYFSTIINNMLNQTK